MKKCPTCNRTYTDEALSFCLDDGAPLLTTSDAPASFDPNATMRYTEARDTAPPTEVYRPGPPSGTGTPIINPSWASIPGAQAAPPPKRKSLLPWIIGGSVLLVVLGIGVVVLLAVLVSLNSNSNNRNSNNSNKGSGASLTNANNANSKNANDNSSSSAALTDDFTEAKWLTGNFSNGNFWYQNDEYHMRATADHSVVVYAPDKDTYYTQDSTVRVTVRSVSGTTPSYGYGVAVLGRLDDKDQLADYSFLIFTGNDPQYKVALHKDGKETPIVSWTRTSTIRTGSSPNQLEVRLKGDQMSFYINGQYATSIKDTAGYEEGSVGFYTSDTYEIAFDDLEISR